MFIEGQTVNLNNLLFDTKNPRLGAWFDNNDIDDPNQDQILNYFKENKKEAALDDLIKAIKVDKILHEPLAVQKNSSGEFIVREGNRRLAALYLLKQEGSFDKNSISTRFPLTISRQSSKASSRFPLQSLKTHFLSTSNAIQELESLALYSSKVCPLL